MVGKKSKHLNVLIDPSFQGVNRLFLYDLKMLLGREIHNQYYFPTAKIKDYNIMANEINLFDQLIKKRFKNI